MLPLLYIGACLVGGMGMHISIVFIFVNLWSINYIIKGDVVL
jgi:hypothetical protein